MGEEEKGVVKIPKEFVIPPIEMRVSRKVEHPGRTEHFHHARMLFRRLQQIGERRLVIQSMIDGGKPVDDVKVDALTHYLWAGSGLKYFRRACQWHDAEAWRNLKHRISIN